jgi:hypothetical protein
MSPEYRAPQNRPTKSDETRSFWTTTWIFVTLVVLTALMAFFVKELVGGSLNRPETTINATK